MRVTEISVPGTGAPARGARRRARTQAAIVEAAETVFARDGYERARIEEIAQLGDVSVGSIYTHFDGKRGLYLAVVERVLELFAGYMDRTRDAALGPLQQVLAGGDAYLRFHVEHPGAFRFLAFRAPEGGSAGDLQESEVRIREQVGALLDGFAAQIEAAMDAGEARSVDARRLADYLWGAWNGVIGLRFQPDGLRLSEEQITETLELARWLLREGLAAPALRDASGEVGERVPLPRIR